MLYKKRKPINQSKQTSVETAEDSNNAKPQESNNLNPPAPYNPNDTFRAGYKLLAKATSKVKKDFSDFNSFCGSATLKNHLWLGKYYKAYRNFPEKAIEYVVSDNGETAVIHFQNGHIGTYNIPKNKLEKNSFEYSDEYTL